MLKAVGPLSGGLYALYKLVPCRIGGEGPYDLGDVIGTLGTKLKRGCRESPRCCGVPRALKRRLNRANLPA